MYLQSVKPRFHLFMFVSLIRYICERCVIPIIPYTALLVFKDCAFSFSCLQSRCVLGCAPSYLRVLCCPVSVLAARRVLRSAARGEFLVPRARLAIMQRRA